MVVMQRWPSSRGWFVLQLLLVTLAACSVLAFVQGSAPGIYEYDGPYHIRYAELLRHDLAAGRGFSHEFPWWQETFLREHWADKDFLYHLLLIPFTFGDLDVGGKTASIAFGTTMFVCIFLSMRWLRVPAAWIWTLALLVSSTMLLYRAGLLRSHVVAISIAVLGTAAIVRERRLGTAVASAAYAYTHTGWHLLPGFALLYDAIGSLLRRRARFDATAFSLMGTAVAVVLNPYFPANLRLWWVQNVDVLVMAWSPSSPNLSLGTEYLPASATLLLYYNFGPALFTLAGILLALGAWRGGLGAAAVPLTFGAVTLGFLALSLASRRFIEFWASFSVVFAATTAGWFMESRGPSQPSRLRAVLVTAAITVVFTALGAHNITEAHRVISDDPGRIYKNCAEWIRDNVPADQTVFTTDWDEFPELFLVAPRQRYLVGLDPTFMYVTNPARWRLWRGVVELPAASIYDPIAAIFKCKYVFADAGFTSFIERADQDPLFRAELKDPDCSVYSLRDAEDPPGVRGPNAMIRVGPWRSGEGGPISVGPHDFLDVDLLRSTAREHAAIGDCLDLQSEIDASVDGEITLAFSTDDSIQVQLGGRSVYDSATAAPPLLQDVLREQEAGGRRPFEHAFKVKVTKGPQTLAMRTCRIGSMWGFYLR